MTGVTAKRHGINQSERGSDGYSIYAQSTSICFPAYLCPDIASKMLHDSTQSVASRRESSSSAEESCGTQENSEWKTNTERTARSEIAQFEEVSHFRRPGQGFLVRDAEVSLKEKDSCSCTQSSSIPLQISEQRTIQGKFQPPGKNAFGQIYSSLRPPTQTCASSLPGTTEEKLDCRRNTTEAFEINTVKPS